MFYNKIIIIIEFYYTQWEKIIKKLAKKERERGNALRPKLHNITFDNYYHRFIDYVIVIVIVIVIIYMYVCMYVYFMMYMTFVYSECNGFVSVT